MLKIVHVFIPLLLITGFVVGCSASTNEIPSNSHIDLLNRYPIHTVQIQGHRLAYLDQGEGPPLILIHGFGGSMWQWEQQQDVLAQQYRVLTLDMLGSGLSDKPELEYSPTFLLNAFTEFMDKMGIQRATLIGNSLGAGVAIGMALTHPERVSKLVLISGFPANILENIQSPSYKRFITTRPPVWLARLGIWIAGRWVTKQVLREIIYDSDQITPLIVERSYQNRRDRGFLPPLYSQIDHIQEWEKSYAPRIGHITHPTLIVWGEKDQIFPPSVGKTLHTTISHSTFLEVANSGHIPQWENPQIFNPALLEFLADN